jgi:hypothetical protein
VIFGSRLARDVTFGLRVISRPARVAKKLFQGNALVCYIIIDCALRLGGLERYIMT